MRLKPITVIASILLLLVAVASVGAKDDIFEKPTTFGVKAGLWKPGTVYVGGMDDGSSISYMVGGLVDYKLAPKFSGGLNLDIANMSSFDESSTLLMIGFMMKAWIVNEDETYIIRPGFGISYGNLGGNDAIDGTDHLILNGVVELVIPGESMNWLFELGITGSVDGGNDDVEVTYGPGFILRGGLVF